MVGQVLRRRLVRGKGPPRGCGSSVSLGFDRVGYVTAGRGLTGINSTHFSLVSTLLFWVIISQVGIENPTGPADFAWDRCVGTWNFLSIAFSIFDRVGMTDPDKLRYIPDH